MQVTTGNHYLAFVLTQAMRDRLLIKYAQYMKRHTVVVCHHVTIAYGFQQWQVKALQDIVDSKPIITLDGLLIGDGIDCFKVKINGEHKGVDGRTYHLTSSRSSVKRDVESNDLLSGEIHTFATVKASDILEGTFQLIPKKLKL